MNQEKALIDAIYSDRLRRAREMSAEEKLDAGAELFETGLELMRAGIRNQFPELDAEGVETEVDRRLALARQMESVLWRVSDLLPR